MRLSGLDASALAQFLQRFGLRVVLVEDGAPIPGSYWGAPEAGLIGSCVYARDDTPVHSLLHEACHYLCMTPRRRRHLHTNAGGDHDEENCVCYLQLILADYLPGFSRTRMAADMDAWGYSFRLGSAQAWFERDAEEARAALIGWGMLDSDDRPSWRLRDASEEVLADVERA